MDEAEFCERLGLIREGKLVAVGTTEELKNACHLDGLKMSFARRGGTIMRVTGVIIRIIRQFFRDKRSLAMMFGAPMLLLWLLSLVFTQKDYIPQIAVVDMPAQIVKVMKNQEASIYEYSKEKAISELENKR